MHEAPSSFPQEPKVAQPPLVHLAVGDPVNPDLQLIRHVVPEVVPTSHSPALALDNSGSVVQLFSAQLPEISQPSAPHVADSAPEAVYPSVQVGVQSVPAGLPSSQSPASPPVKLGNAPQLAEQVPVMSQTPTDSERLHRAEIVPVNPSLH